MWNLRSHARREGGEEISELKSNGTRELSSLNTDGDDATATRTTTGDGDLSEHRGSNKSEDEVLGKLESDELSNHGVTVIDVEEGMFAHRMNEFLTLKLLY